MKSSQLSVPTGSLRLLCLLLGIGVVILAFTHATVNNRTIDEVPRNTVITYWLQHGYFDLFGLQTRPGPNGVTSLYRSTTGFPLVSGLILEKIWVRFTGHPSWRLLALHNEGFSLLTSALLGLLGFRLAVRLGTTPLHAFALAIALEAVWFTFPDNLMLFFGLSGRVWWLFAVLLFLLIEERAVEGRTRSGTMAQAIVAFFATYSELVAGMAFVASYALIVLLMEKERAAVKRLLVTALLPTLLALGVYQAQITMATARHPELPVMGSNFAFRTGLDGDTTYYIDHLDIAYGRAVARANFRPQSRASLFRWEWLFFAGCAAVIALTVLGIRKRIPLIVLLALFSLLGSYLLYAAMFSQGVMIHPYYYDVMIFTPLVLALFVLVPSLIESQTGHAGVTVVAAVFLAAWVSMVQMRKYAITFPPKGLTSSMRAIPAARETERRPLSSGATAFV